MSEQNNKNTEFCEKILYKLLDIENELAEYIEENITKGGDINDIYPYAFDKVREYDLMSNRPYGEIFTFTYIIVNQEKFISQMDEIKDFSRALRNAKLENNE